jgi:catechol 2,3-dioxygenase
MAGIDRGGYVVRWVSDVAREDAFYCDVLGMEVVNHDAAAGEAFLSFGAQHHDLALFRGEGEGTCGTRGLEHIAFHVAGGIDDLRVMYERLRAEGVAIERTSDHGMTVSVYFRDPEGNRLEVYTDSMAEAEGLQFMRDNGGLRHDLNWERAAT